MLQRKIGQVQEMMNIIWAPSPACEGGRGEGVEGG